MFRLAANLSFLFGDAPFLDRFERAAKAGFKGVEYFAPYDHDPAELLARLRGNGLEQVLFNTPIGNREAGDSGLAAVPGREAEFRASLDDVLRYADALECRRIHIMAGNATGPEARATFLANLEYAARAFESHGVTPLIEPLNRRDAPGYFLTDFVDALDVIAAVGGIRLQFDIYHRQIIHGDVTRGLQRLMPITGHIQISSAPERNEPTTGELDDVRILEIIDALNYPGFVGCEYRPRGGTLEGLGWLDRITR